MAKLTNYTIFLSRPSDVESDMEVVKQAISDANSLCAPIGIRFDTFDWRENATPGISSEPQARIDEQSEGYDALIAVMGATLGTPTKDHSSGCVGEIEGALALSNSSVFQNDSVMVFFKDVQLNLSSDLTEAQKVKELKDGLGPKGVLWRPFNDDESLRNGVLRSLGVLVARHLSGVIKPDRSVTPSQDSTASDDAQLANRQVPAVELGIVDYSEIAESEIEAAGASAVALAEAMTVLGQIATEQTPAIQDANSRGDKAAASRALGVIADAMEGCADTVQHEGDAMSERFTRSLDALRNILEIQAADLDGSVVNSELEIARNMTEGLAETLDTVIQQTIDFKEGIAAVPRLTKELNSSKKNLLRSTENLISSLRKISQENSAIYDYSVSGLNSSPAALES